MNCDRNCEGCPFAPLEAVTGRDITVNVVGSVPDGALLDFSAAPVLVFAHRGYSIKIVNLSGDSHHIGRKILKGSPDVVLDVVPATDLESGLELTARLIDMDTRTIVALDGYDRLLATGHSVDWMTFGGLVGMRVMPLQDSAPETLSRLLSAIVDSFEEKDRRHVHVPYGTDIEEAVEAITKQISKSERLCSLYHDRYIALRLLEDPDYIIQTIGEDPALEAITAEARRQVKRLRSEFGRDCARIVADARMGFISGALQETLRHSSDNSDHTITQKIDSVLTSRWLGLPILILVLFGVFEATFALGAYPQEWIESGIAALGGWLKATLSPGWLTSLLTDGIVQGVGAVLAFLPNIVILFFFLSLLEDSGYMARAAFLMDKLMHRIGLHGRSFIPMLIGFGCNVPAIMAARSIEDRRDRTLTMLMIPFMSCSARLPVYLLFVGAFFARYKALVMIGLYAGGILLSIIFAFLMKRTKWFRKSAEDYVSELPPFRKPTFKNTGLHIWERVSDYLQKISTVILAASVIIWALEYFPADRTQGGTLKEESVLADVGRAMTPVMEPLGFDWKMNVCLLTGLPAKEAIVSTMGILYHTEDESSLADAMRTDEGVTPAAALAFMIFVLLYFPCIATIATLKREAGGRWAAFTVVHSLLLAWVAALVVFQVGSLIL